ncbi:MAG: hypothetical protein HYY06_21355 [Deltaproteobacteria bacterium]|nr:hypothetical protein [Deltaproteobacteria bacterium]
MRLATVLLLSALGACTSAATGQDAPDGGRPVDPLADRLEGADTRLRTRGYTAVERAFRGFLIEGKAEVHSLKLRAGRCATAIGATSDALTELELLLYDGGGSEVARAVGAGPHPVLTYCTSRAGAHYFVVRAARGNGLYSTRLYDSPPGLAGATTDLFGPPARGSP